ncbi:MAG: transposase [Clostridia bacterium]|nr:transposase [Clostridia bacterium]
MNRSIQVEGAFGVIKQDMAFRRFLTRGKKKTESQFFLIAIAFDIKKLWNRQQDGRSGLKLFNNETA